jgi:Ran GTPase-activating protein (RanGAP) involved in mRNA processing and transport
MITVGKNGVIPAKELRENTIASLDLSSKGLGVDGALILAALIKDNTTVLQLNVSSNGLGPEGGTAISASIAENTTLTSVSPLFSLFFLLFHCTNCSCSYLSFPLPVATSFEESDGP